MIATAVFKFRGRKVGFYKQELVTKSVSHYKSVAYIAEWRV